MSSILLTILFTTIALIVIIAMVWLVFEFKKLKHEYNTLYQHLQRNDKDIAGLCSAALSVDKQQSETLQQLDGILESIAGFEQHEQASHPYHSAIQMVRNGADTEQLIEQCGLSQEEAALLIRLHGNSKNKT